VITTLFLVACLDANVRTTCIDVEISDSTLDTTLTELNCHTNVGSQIVADYMRQHGPPGQYADFGGWKCRNANQRKPKEGAA
jgi:hypothetical protein